MDVSSTSAFQSAEKHVPHSLISTTPLEGYLGDLSSYVDTELADLKNQLRATSGTLSKVHSATSRIQQYLLRTMPNVEEHRDAMLNHLNISINDTKGYDTEQGQPCSSDFTFCSEGGGSDTVQKTTSGKNEVRECSLPDGINKNNRVEKGPSAQCETLVGKIENFTEVTGYGTPQGKNYKKDLEKALTPLLFFEKETETKECFSGSHFTKDSLLTERPNDTSLTLQQDALAPKNVDGDSNSIENSNSRTICPSSPMERMKTREESSADLDQNVTTEISASDQADKGILINSSNFLSSSSHPTIHFVADLSNKPCSGLSTLQSDKWNDDDTVSVPRSAPTARANGTEEYLSDFHHQNTQKLLVLLKRLRKDFDELQSQVDVDREKEKKTVEENLSTRERLATTIVELQESQRTLHQVSQWLGLLNSKTGETERLPFLPPSSANADGSTENSLASLYALDSFVDKVEPMIAISPLLMTFRQILFKDFHERTGNLSEACSKEIGTSSAALRFELDKFFTDAKEKEVTAIAARESLNDVLASYDRRLTDLELTAIRRPEFVSSLKGKMDTFSAAQQGKIGVPEISLVEKRIHRRLQELEERVAYYEAERKELREIILALLQIDKGKVVNEMKSSNLLGGSPFPPFPPRILLGNKNCPATEERGSQSLSHSPLEERNYMNSSTIDPSQVVEKTIYRIMPHNVTTLREKGGIENRSQEEITFATFTGASPTNLLKDELLNSSRTVTAAATLQDTALHQFQSQSSEEEKRRGTGGSRISTNFSLQSWSVGGKNGHLHSSPSNPHTSPIQSPFFNEPLNLKRERGERPSPKASHRLPSSHSSCIHPRTNEENHASGSNTSTRNGIEIHSPSKSNGLELRPNSNREMIGLTRNQEAYVRYVTKDFNRSNINNLPPIPYERHRSP